MAADFERRFQELCKQADEIEASKRYEAQQYGVSGNRIDDTQFLNWKVKVRHLLEVVCGQNSTHVKQFATNEKHHLYTTNHETFLRLQAVLLAAKDDYEGGYLSSLKLLVQSDIFDSELEQAQELFDAGYLTAAAVVAGVVLETGLREMCSERSIAIGKLDRMNAELAKAGAYNKLRQKQITALADIRNSAAHGHPESFQKEDVARMIQEVQSILAERT
jgi:hypothetical protein